ncbi:hypothetical protein LTR99_008830 [Exophiala xenobiotica]|uniref:Cytochrome P450 n=1 Tax=Vermiconidia calcicola TaxID=1690605 RepID=A0AAV9Q5Q1_9PEZI|nr:hypothetical protein LTR96_009099 [Exophiala xenobiotica]KAK5533474.1 hypothetical protein LTR25_007340 [Vermiconidia calcicola]KAK5542935.1 hypothetical protein LTR23_005260 [Chaetothyriales sp. CCFEE 6169]KAK5296463.1 hypothetical protein LTR99_008830 [Exophiala xenobiotica]KAK5334516.1 hypothetical protein LTR98_009470 [Exophiala xenobiotica]
MGYSTSTIVLAVAAATLLWTLHLIISSTIRRRQYKLPAQVPGIPIFGNSFQMPLTQVEQAPWAQKLAQKYGEMFTLRLGTSDFVFLNSSRVVADLLEKRASKYSSRNPMPFVQDLMSGGKRIVLMGYTDQWRELRKVMHSILNSRQMTQFAEYQDLESKQLLWDYLKQPDLWFKANQRYANAVIMSVVFGRRLLIDDENLEPLLKQAEDMVNHLQPGSTLVDTFPVLSRLPLWMQWWRAKGLTMFEESKRVYGKEVDRVKARILKGDARPCFAIDFLKETEKSNMDDDQKLFALGSLLEAGSDTSRMTMSQLIAAAVLQPDWVERAREQLDRVCGDAKRLPRFEDKPNLPFITAAVKEGFRWYPFGPIGVPHMMSQDDEYEGYKLPAGTMVTWNMHHLSRSPDEFEDPERFWPERFMNDDLNNPLKGHWAFGAGRRVCPGYNVAETNLWMFLSRLLYCFDFQAIPGKEIELDKVVWPAIDYAPFAVKIVPRSPAHRALIEKECSHVSNIVY